MKRILLLSAPTGKGIAKIFPDEIKNKVLAYLPVDGTHTPEKYINEWRGYAEKYQAEFLFINNSKVNAIDEQEKLLRANICFISGGNTFLLLKNLRRSKLDKALKEFVKKDEFVLAGASAGALVLTPTIKICNLPGYDENVVGLMDLKALSLVNFEVFPHFVEERHRELLEKYRAGSDYEVKVIKDGEFIMIND